MAAAFRLNKVWVEKPMQVVVSLPFSSGENSSDTKSLCQAVKAKKVNER